MAPASRVSMSSIIGEGVDGLNTDEPAVARAVLQQRSEMSDSEQLLVERALRDSSGTIQ